MKDSFSLAPSPLMHFGAGKISVLPSEIKTFGTRVLLVTGARSFSVSNHYHELFERLRTQGTSVEHLVVSVEPTPAIVDEAVKKFASFDPEVVAAIGGGSVLDAGKAIAAMLPLGEPVKDYLEGVGVKPAHPGVKVPFIALPTTAGTGSEVAKNAVLSETGKNGYKRSLRHNNFVPNVAIIDPALSLTCPKATTAASGMDAFTQLLESYVSTGANSITDALALDGLQRVSENLLAAYHLGPDIKARTGMALAAYLSGVTLTNAGLGLVHGFAASIGGYFSLAHGVICSSLMAATNRVTVRKLRAAGSNPGALLKYAIVGKMFTKSEGKTNDYYVDSLLDTIEAWAAEMAIPKLSSGGVTSLDFARIADVTDNKNNPVALNKEEMMEILKLANS